MEVASSPRTTVILLNYNGLKDLETCLPSLRPIADRGEAEILVVDNGSSDGSVEWMRKTHSWVKLHEHGKNWGFAEGINRILPLVKTPYFALLNNDTEVESDWLCALIEVLDSEPTVAAVQARIMLWDRRHLIQSAGGGMTQHGYGYDRAYGRWYRAPFDQRSEVFFVSAGAALYRRAAWDQVGGFDPHYFMYHEDVDWSWRAWLAGWRLLYEPRAVVYHKMGATTTRVLGFSARQSLGERHRIRTLLKLSQMPLGLRRIYVGLRTRDWRRAWLLLKCLGWNLRQLFSTLRLRRTTLRQISRGEAEKHIHPHFRAPDLLASYSPTSVARIRKEMTEGVLTAASAFQVGDGDLPWLGIGWHMPEPSGSQPVRVRWMAEEAEIYVYGHGKVQLDLIRWVGREGLATIGELELAVLEGDKSTLRSKIAIELEGRGLNRLDVSLGENSSDSLFRLRFLCAEVRRDPQRLDDARELSLGVCGWRVLPSQGVPR